MRMFRSSWLSLAVLAAVAAAPARAAEVGTNLDPLQDFSVQYPFVDAFRQSRDWIPQNATVFDTGERALLDLDADGWVQSIPPTSAPPQFDRVATLLFFNGLGSYPAGTYIVTFDGQGQIEYGDDAVKNVALSTPNRDVLTVARPSTGIKIVLRSTAPAPNHIRNIHVWMPGFDEVTGPQQVYHPDFLAVIQPFTVLRFMDWMQTNNSPQVNFSDRPRTTDARWTIDGKGVPLETMVDLANRTGKDPWFNMPHKATDNYVRDFATLVKNTLAAGRKVYVEYSNEVWNSAFQQGGFVEAQGQAQYPGPDSGFTKRLNRHGERTAQVCDIWQSVFGAQASRVICTLGAQAANAFTATEAMDCPLSAIKPCHAHNIDAVAIAPYFGGYLGDRQLVSIAAVAALTPAQFFTEINSGGVVAGGPAGGAVAETGDWVVAHRREASARGKALVSYEGGQHLVGVFAEDRDNEALTNLFTSVNRDARMGDTYTTYLNQWQANGGELFVHFNSASSYTRFGSWGAVERLDQRNTPKQNALVAFVCSVDCPPTANAGADRTVDEGGAVSLAGSGTDPEGGALTFAWSQVSGPTVTLANANTATASFTAPAVSAQAVLVFRLQVTNPEGRSDDDTVSITVRDLGTPSVFAFSAASYSVGEATPFMTITVKRSGGTAPATVQFATGAGTATAGSDFTAASGTLSFGQGVLSQTFRVAITPDTVPEPPEALSLRLKNPTPNASLGAPSTAILTITDNDAFPVISFAAPTFNVSESGPAATIVVRRSGNLASPSTVTFGTSEGTATSADFASGTAAVSFGPGVASQTVTVAVRDDAAPEGRETFTALLEPPRGALLGAQKTAVVGIVDNDQGLAFSTAAYTVAETVPKAVITVRRSGGTSGTLVASFATSAGTAIPGTDYAETSASLTFGPGVVSKTVAVPILNDTANDGSRTVQLRLTGVTPPTVVGSPGTAVLTIADNEPTFQFTAAALTAAESSRRATFTVKRTGATTGAAEVDFEFAGGTVGGGDVTVSAGSGTLTFGPGVATRTLGIDIVDDDVDEPNETLAIALRRHGSDLPIGTPGTAILTIVDNDGPASVRFSAPSYSVVESDGGTVTITLTRSGGLSEPALVQVELSGGTARNGVHYAVPGTFEIRFAANQASESFDVMILSDGPTGVSNFVPMTMGVVREDVGVDPATITTADLWIVDAGS